MLTSIYIENIAVLKKAEISFEQGFNVLTGETGAGKSVVIHSINMITGERMSREIIRSGEASALAVGEFSGLSFAAKEKLAGIGVSWDEDGKLFLQREITKDGKNSCKVNGRPVNTGTLKEIGKILINIHGQNQNQDLLRSEMHIDILDRFAQNEALLSRYEECFEKAAQARKELSLLLKNKADSEKRKILLEDEIDELSQASPTPGEDEVLQERYRFLQNAGKIAQALAIAQSALFSGMDPSIPAVDLIATAQSALQGAESLSDAAAPLCESLTDIYYRMQDLSGNMEELLARAQIDEQEILDVSQRIDRLGRLKRKYEKESADELLRLLSEKQSELEELGKHDVYESGLSEKYQELKNHLSALAMELTERRKEAARRLQQAVISELSGLDMPNTAFEVQILKDAFEDGRRRYTKKGADRVEFLLSPNRGEEVRPLSKIASGGELSRIMLAMENVLHSEGAETLIFDEIDAGVSGRAAQKMAKKLFAISGAKQVICVTHLSQIAAMANAHFLIEKDQSGDRTQTNIYKLSQEKREAEIARIISGVETTELTKESAREMLDLADKIKKELRGES